MLQGVEPGDTIEMPILTTVRVRMRVREVYQEGPTGALSGLTMEYDEQTVTLERGAMYYDAQQFTAQADLTTFERHP